MKLKGIIECSYAVSRPVKYALLLSALVLSAPVLAQNEDTQTPKNYEANSTKATPHSSHTSNPWDVVPTTVPYKLVGEALLTTAKHGDPSPLNPSCAGMTGDACIRSASQPDGER